MAPPLTIRNLTSTPLELKVVERYEAPDTHKKTWAYSCKKLFTRTSSAPSAGKLGEHAQHFVHQDVSIHVEPFQSVTTSINAPNRTPNDLLRLTFEADGQRYRVDTPSPKNESQTFTPLVPDPRHQYTGVFIPQDTYLSVFSSANLQCWMRELSDVTPLSGLSIPGTHNTPTYHKALPSVRCQAASPLEQLENGVRFFDLRVQPEHPNDPAKDGLILVHGVFPISLTGTKYLRGVLDDAHKFLEQNPTETIIVSLKREGAGSATDQQLSMILHDHYCNDQALWYTEPRIPKLGEVRGKMILLRRFVIDDRLKSEHNGEGWGLDGENWAYNTPDDTHGSVRVQDWCEIMKPDNISQKIEYAEAHMGRAGECVAPLPGITTDAVNPVPPNPLYLNFLSGSNFFDRRCWPEKIAQRLNPHIVEYLCMLHHSKDHYGDGTTGIVVCDWVGEHGDWDLVRCIVGMNAWLEMREKGTTFE